jgi:ergothioneine biosynthesis protein EgtB
MGARDKSLLIDRYATVRRHTEALVQGLSEADCQAQSMPDASPLKWHLAHVSWFFETFVLQAHTPGFEPFDPAFRTLFNSYYHAVGARHPRPERGLITRPGLARVMAYRQHVDAQLQRLLATADAALLATLAPLLELGLHHEQQHQELMQTDFLHLLSCNPTLPAWRAGTPAASGKRVLHWLRFDGGVQAIGKDAGEAFCFDNESPRHRVYLQPFELASCLVTQGAWLAFVQDGAYADSRHWLAAGWDWVQREGIEAPLHWRRNADGPWQRFTVHGLKPLDPHAPVQHISLFEADAYARWCGARLPTEAEWEHAVASAGSAVEQAFGQAWQWTASAYTPYPGYKPWRGAVGEYNGKFMAEQSVLRGSSWATPEGHSRLSYRNFFPASARWQFSGVRLARDA